MLSTNVPRSTQYVSWLSLCFSTGPISVSLRSYIPIIIQSITYKLGHQLNDPESNCRDQDNCYISLLGWQFQSIAYVHYLRASSTVLEVIVTVILSSLADYKGGRYRHALLSSIIITMVVSSLMFAGLEESNPSMKELNISSITYIVMISLIALSESVQSSFMTNFIKVDGLKGSDVSSESSFASNMGSILLLGLGVLLNFYSGSLCSIVVCAGLLGVIGLIFSMIVRSRDATRVTVLDDNIASSDGKLIDVSFFSKLLRFHITDEFYTPYLIAISWLLFTCSMTNFMTNFNMLFRSITTSKSHIAETSANLQFSLFVSVSYISATSSLVLVRSCTSHLTEIRIYQWVTRSFIANIAFSLYPLLGIVFPIGLNNSMEFWIFDVIYIANTSLFRCLMRSVYARYLPEGYECKFFAFEIIGGLVVTSVLGLFNGFIVSVMDIRFCFLLGAILGVASLIVFKQVNFEEESKVGESEEPLLLNE